MRHAIAARIPFAAARGASLFAVTLGLATGHPARAEDAPEAPKPDKSGYTLFNPTPEASLRSFAPDRPAKSTGPTTVDAGHFQYELEAINWARQKTGPVKTTTWVGPNPNFKLGITNSLDLQVAFATFTHIRTKDADTGDESSASGFGDVFIKAKYNLWGNEGGKTALALVPYVKAPTAKDGIGNGATEGGVIIPFTVSLPKDMSLTFNTEFDALKDSAGGGYHAGFVNIIGLSAPLVKDVTLTFELWSSINDDPAGTIRQYSFDTALAWTVRPNLQLDIGANFGLNRDTPAVQLYGGIAQRF